jgi:hypothetical protein
VFTSKGTLHSSRGPVSCAIGVILIHLIVILVHGFAHGRLAISLNAAQEIFIVVVITVAPVVAGYLLWKDTLRSGGVLLAASMAGAFVFGVFYHFIAPGGDNVNRQFPGGPANWILLFDQTAVGLAVLEILGMILGLLLVLKSGGRAGRV